MTRNNHPSIMREKKGKVKMDKFDKLLVRVGMPPHLKGYRCTKEALRLLQENPDYIDYLTKGLYPAVGEKLGTTGSRVERALRHGVETVFDRISPELEEEMFGNSVSGMKGKPTNGEFLAIMVLHLEDE